MPRALITTIPFAEKEATPLRLLQDAGIDYTINPLGRKITEMELSEMIANFDILIAGTEPITEQVLAPAHLVCSKLGYHGGAQLASQHFPAQSQRAR